MRVFVVALTEISDSEITGLGTLSKLTLRCGLRDDPNRN